MQEQLRRILLYLEVKCAVSIFHHVVTVATKSPPHHLSERHDV
jgi:hypothetical protein